MDRAVGRNDKPTVVTLIETLVLARWSRLARLAGYPETRPGNLGIDQTQPMKPRKKVFLNSFSRGSYSCLLNRQTVIPTYHL